LTLRRIKNKYTPPPTFFKKPVAKVNPRTIFAPASGA